MKPSRPYHAVTSYHREPGGLRRLDFFVDRIRTWQRQRLSQSPIRILDIGCGKGNLALPLAQLGYEVTGVDYDAESIASATAMAKDCRVEAKFVCGSMEKVQGQMFDVIIASEVLEHQKNPNEFLDVLKTVCAPDGILLLSVPNGESLEERIRRFTTHTKPGRAAKGWLKSKIGHESVQSAASHPHEQFFSWSALAKLCWRNGWKIVHVAGASAFFKEFFYLFGRVAIRRGSRLFHVCDQLDSAFASVLPRRMSDGWLLEVRPFDVSKPRVMQVVTTLLPGGAERVVFELSSRLSRYAYAVHVVSIFGGGALARLFQEARVDLTVFEPRASWWKTFWKLRALMEQERPHVVHTHLFGADVLGRLAAWSLGIRCVVSTEHSVNVEHGIVKRWVKGVMARRTPVFVAVSHVVAKAMKKREGIPEKRIRVIPNGIDLERFHERPPRSFRDVPRLLTIGRLEQQKGQDILLKALALVKHPYCIHIVGTGSKERELKALAERLHISSRIEWLGYRQDIPELLVESDVFCFPSRWEGQALVLMEAAATGVPIIASDLPVFQEMLQQSEALFVPMGDVPAWAAAIERVLQDPLSASERASRAERTIRDRYAVQHMVEAYAKLYREMMNGKKRV